MNKIQVKNVIEIYRNNIKIIFFYISVTTIPILFIYQMLVNVAVDPFLYFGNSLWASIIRSYFMFLFFLVLMIPFISITKFYLNNEETTIQRTFSDLIYLFPVYTVGVYVSLVVTLGYLLFIIPGLIISVLMVGISCAAVIDNKKWWKGIKISFKFGKSNFTKLLIWLITFTIIDFMVSVPAYYIGLSITPYSIGAQLLMLLFHSILIPIIAIA
ncbi:hypothetical protein CEN49_21775, partial [Fischerella thermalis CCMEE 5273]